MRTVIVGILAVLLCVSCGTDDLGTGRQELLQRPGAKPCAEDPSFVCFPLSVPLDHRDPNGRRIDVHFAVRPADKAPRQGVLVSIAGGPGYSGIDELDDWKGIARELARTHDLVTFDLRGVKRSGNLDCPRAATAFYKGGLRAATAAEEKQLTAKTRAFVRDCLAELKMPVERLVHYNTTQAADDLDALRASLGAETLKLYGLSYGTMLAQTYAYRYPKRTRLLVLDGVVDMALSHIDWMLSLNGAVSTLVERSARECASLSDCATQFPLTGAAAAYEAIGKQLDASPVEVDKKKLFTRSDFDSATADAMDSPYSRFHLLDAVASAVTDKDFGPLAKIAGGRRGERSDGGMSDAIYYLFSCNDYGWDSMEEGERERLYLEAGRRARDRGDRVLSPYYGDLPCVYWPVGKLAGEPLGLKFDDGPTGPIPLLAVGATGDNSTPFEQGLVTAFRAVAGRAISFDGGRHVMVGRGEECIDTPVAAFLVRHVSPATPETKCQGEFLQATDKAPPPNANRHAQRQFR